jgi:DNA-binding response OmpR family regulator
VPITGSALENDLKKHLVVADDEPHFRQFVRQVAELTGWRVSECADGHELKSLLAEIATPSLLVLDLVMPDEDGVEVLQWLSRDKNPVPVCIVTGGTAVRTTLESAILLGKRVPVTRTLLKPVSIKELTDVLDNVA